MILSKLCMLFSFGPSAVYLRGFFRKSASIPFDYAFFLCSYAYLLYTIYKQSKRNEVVIVAYKNMKLSEEKVFKDPVHRYIHVRDQVIWDLIATPEFQRLRRIKQLGTTYMTFHGAEHSRFNH